MRPNSNGPREHLWLFKVQIIEIAASQKCFLSSGKLAGTVTITVLGRIFRTTKCTSLDFLLIPHSIPFHTAFHSTLHSIPNSIPFHVPFHFMFHVLHKTANDLPSCSLFSHNGVHVWILQVCNNEHTMKYVIGQLLGGLHVLP